MAKQLSMGREVRSPMEYDLPDHVQMDSLELMQKQEEPTGLKHKRVLTDYWRRLCDRIISLMSDMEHEKDEDIVQFHEEQLKFLHCREAELRKRLENY
mmetsp:Transcript_37051/g.147856  ORF Transcript_37051/g.147856 Transcript_37051/m.147856 type:complete len:98 (-) Transcript_37051:981-1274(-)|eukprot:CAMPEP_0113959968 /NCGR_PEP_ID=MMETSP0011_2-20120614/4448_1 /TAXON_ID=101924 /ORGANISM="Rhodosorus marinus" /LENGTH=97 /DNA_ID=CAMNT_0000971357 /DNA_START=71 /DNA_END=364 /DNA_ORIENTATION=- /assembly_acc=CAM_ASM_000156